MDGTSAPHYSPEYLQEYNGDEVIACAIVFIVLETILISLRFVARHLKKVNWGWDDSFIVGAAIFSYALISACIADVYAGGVGHHIGYVELNTPWKLEAWGKFTIVIPLMYLPAVALPKLSIIALYLRIFSDRNHHIICWVTAGLIVANCIGSIIPAFVACIPLEYLWNRALPGGGTCINFNAWYRWSSVTNILTDVIMLILPIPAILKLQASVSMKIGLVITFMTGSIGVITAIIRFVGFFTQDMTHDGTWTATRLIILSIMEPGLYILAACLICLKPLLQRVWDKTPLSSLTSKRAPTDHSKNNNYKINNYKMLAVDDRAGNMSPSHALSSARQ